MYKVFVNDVPIILSTKREIGEHYLSVPIKRANLKKLIKQISKGAITHLHLYHPKEEKLLKHLKKKLPVVPAAGGLVFNQNRDVLFIYRNKRWDIPKGKIEKKESIEAAAIREVEEETGVESLEIEKFITITYHIFKRNNKFKLKETHWFQMSTTYEGELIPEESEGIQKVKWKNLKKSRKALANSYENIKMVFPEKYLA
ncbi:NUDIX domain-containing protein [Gangjinia marincola]|uniref:NUDIX domain-containing protein n=1 Tax=Gangjinia marincola TaxID=578463 RepID=A0ABN1MIX7_9FLAO